MKRAEVQMPDAPYQKMEGLAERLQLTVPELLSHAAQEIVDRQKTSPPNPDAAWRFPDGLRLGQ